MRNASTIEVSGTSVPGFLYGTAWKEDETERLVRLAIDAGFRGIDTANQRRHYFEAAAGVAVAAAIADGVVRREDLFLQTKFTYLDSQDHRLPYDASAPLPAQVGQSLASSLEHLQVAFVDSYVLHGPERAHGLCRGDQEVWRAMEEIHASGQARLLGISNVALDQLEKLWEVSEVKPSFVQNRCFARTGWDRNIRAFCRDHDIVYQGFSLLTANSVELRHPRFRELIPRYGRNAAQIVFRFALEVGILPLTGTTDPLHMREDLAAYDFQLDAADARVIEGIAG